MVVVAPDVVTAEVVVVRFEEPSSSPPQAEITMANTATSSRALVERMPATLVNALAKLPPGPRRWFGRRHWGPRDGAEIVDSEMDLVRPTAVVGVALDHKPAG